MDGLAEPGSRAAVAAFERVQDELARLADDVRRLADDVRRLAAWQDRAGTWLADQLFLHSVRVCTTSTTAYVLTEATAPATDAPYDALARSVHEVLVRSGSPLDPGMRPREFNLVVRAPDARRRKMPGMRARRDGEMTRATRWDAGQRALWGPPPPPWPGFGVAVGHVL